MTIAAGSPQAAASYEVLLAVGVTLCLFGIVLRGFHQANRRAAAARAQKARLNRVAGLAPEAGDAPPPENWFVRRLPWCYRASVVIGAILMVVAFARR